MGEASRRRREDRKQRQATQQRQAIEILPSGMLIVCFECREEVVIAKFPKPSRDKHANKFLAPTLAGTGWDWALVGFEENPTPQTPRYATPMCPKCIAKQGLVPSTDGATMPDSNRDEEERT